MTSRTTMPKISRRDVVATDARRRWTLEEKQQIVAEIYAGPRLVSATAQRHGLSTVQLFAWRRLARSGRLVEDAPVTFTQAIVAAEPSAHAPPIPPEGHKPPGNCRMEIIVPNGRRVVVGPDVDRAALTRILDVLERRP